MLRILYYVPELSIGGTEKQLLHLVRGLDRRSFDPAMWCPGRRGPLGRQLEDAGAAILRGNIEPADIFHSFSYCRDASDVLAARAAGIPIVITTRRNLRHWDRSGCLRSWELQRNRATDLIIANCRAVASLSARVERIPHYKIRMIYNGVAIPRAGTAYRDLRRELGLSPGSLLVGNVANLKPVKGQDTLLRAFHCVTGRLPEVSLVICGDGPCRQELHRLRESLGLQRRVFFLGQRSDTDPVYRSLDLYVHSSRAEGFPNAVLEAMAHGLAVVATNAGGTAEAVLDGATGRLVPPEDPDALAAALERLLQDAALRRRMGREARTRAKECFQVSRMVREHEAIYRALSINTRFMTSSQVENSPRAASFSSSAP